MRVLKLGVLFCFLMGTCIADAKTRGYKKIPGVYRQGMVGQVNSLDPTTRLNEVEELILDNMQAPLLSIDPKTGKLVPRGAASFDVAPDGLTIDFRIRDDLFFSNGAQVMADDYAFAIKRHLDPKNKSAFEKYVSYIGGAFELLQGMFYHPDRIGVRAYVEKGKQHLRIELVKPFPKILYFFAHPASMPIHKQSFVSEGAKYFRLGSMHASGPFIGVKKTSSLFVFAKNPYHHLKNKIQLKQVQLRLYQTGQAADFDFLRGKIDQVGSQKKPVGVNMVEKLQGSDVLFFQPDAKTIFLRFNTQKLKTKPLKLRQALAKAINRKELEGVFLAHGQKTTFSIVPGDQGVYDPPHAYYEALFDAKKILKELGYCTEKKSEMAALPCMKLPSLSISFPNNLHSRKIALAIKGQWQRLGFTEIITDSQNVKDFVENINQGAFSIALDEIAVDRFNFFDLLHAFESDQPTSVGVKYPHFDQLMAEAKHQPNWHQAMQRYRDAESFLLTQASIIPLVQMATPIAKAVHVKGFDLNLWDIHRWKDISIH